MVQDQTRPFLFALAARFVFALLLACAQLIGARLEGADGDLDLTFNINGYFIQYFDAGGDNYDVANAVAELPDGRLVIVGTVEGNPYRRIGILVLNEDGTPDQSVWPGGKTTLQVPRPIGQPYYDDNGIDVAVQADGKIILIASSEVSGNDWLWAIGRLDLATGAADPTFGIGGWATYDINNLFSNGWDLPSAVAIQPDGKILVAGTAATDHSEGKQWRVIRLLPTGVLDPSFGGTGSFAHIWTGGIGANNPLTSLAITRNGRILAAGTFRNGAYIDEQAVAAIRPDGTLDDSWTVSGTQTIYWEVGGSYYDATTAALAVTPTNHIYFAGWTNAPGSATANNFALARLDNLGQPWTFASGDHYVWAGLDLGVPPYVSDIGRALALQANGKPVVAGEAGYAPHPSLPYTYLHRLALVRWTTAGVLDSGFGTSGVSLHTLGSGGDDLVRDAILDRRGRLVVVGAARHAIGDFDYLVARFDVGGVIFGDGFEVP